MKHCSELVWSLYPFPYLWKQSVPKKPWLREPTCFWVPVWPGISTAAWSGSAVASREQGSVLLDHTGKFS